MYSFDLKTAKQSPFDPRLKEPVAPKLQFAPVESSKDWDRGVVYAEAQNLARTLMELPANMMTPTVRFPVILSFTVLKEIQIFCERVKKEFEGIPNVEIIVRDEGRFLHWLLCGENSQHLQPGPLKRAW